MPAKEITTAEAAARLNVNQSRVRQLVLAGKLPARPPNSRLLLIPEAAVNRLAAQRDAKKS